MEDAHLKFSTKYDDEGYSRYFQQKKLVPKWKFKKKFRATKIFPNSGKRAMMFENT